MGRLTLPSIASAVRSSIPAVTILSIVSSASCYQKHHASAFVTNSPCPRYQVSTTALSASWKPCAQPRFDEFANCIVGPWNLPAADDDAQPKKEEVEEVMRSCGGAIQGIRDLPLSNIFPEAGEEDRTYHNRADGGFGERQLCDIDYEYVHFVIVMRLLYAVAHHKPTGIISFSLLLQNNDLDSLL